MIIIMAICIKKSIVKYNSCKQILNLVRNTHECLNIKEKFSEEINDLEFKTAKPYSEIPGPKSIPILGNLWTLIPFIGPYAGMGYENINVRQHEEYGDIVKIGGLALPDIIICYNPKDIEKVFRREGPWPKRNLFPILSHYRVKMRPEIFKGYGGIFTVDGPDWLDARSKLNPIMMKPKVVKQYLQPVEEIADSFVKKIDHLRKQDANSEMPDNFSMEINKYTLEAVCRMTMDINLDLFNLEKPPNKEAMDFLNSSLDFLPCVYNLDMKPSPWKYITTPTFRKFVKGHAVMTSFVKKHLDEAFERVTKRKNIPVEDQTILEKFILTDKERVFANIMDIFVGAIDTTGRVLQAWFYYISTNQEAQKKLREEVLSVLPTVETPLTTEALNKLEYLRATIKETMRLAPVSLGTMRNLDKDVVLSGYRVPKRTNILLPFRTLCLKEEYFHEPKKFLPERWLRKDGTRSFEVNPWVYQPFGFGPRACVGKRLADLEMEVLLAKVIRNFQLEWFHEPIKFKADIFYGVDGPLNVCVKSLNK